MSKLFESTFLRIQVLGRPCNRAFRGFMEHFGIIELCDAINDQLAEHSLLRFIILTVAISCAIPVVMFILFGIASLAITFVVFIFIGGTILVVCGLCLFICIAVMILVLSLITVTLVAFYMLTLKLRGALVKFEMTSYFKGKKKFMKITEHLSLKLW